MVALQFSQREPERLDGAFQPLEQVHRHQCLQAPLAVGLPELASSALDFGVVDRLVLRQATRQDVADRGVDGELQQRELLEDLIEADDVSAMRQLAVERQRLAAFRERADVLGVVERLDVLA